MQEPLLEALRCPGCGDGVLTLNIVEADAREVRSGQVTCRGCDRKFPVRDGILDMLLPTDVIRKEQAGCPSLLKGTQWNPQEWTDQFLLSLPRVPREVLSTNDEHLNDWHKRADNFEDALRRQPPVAGERVLDVGAGRCWASAALARLGCRVVALDIIPDKYIGLESGEVFFQREPVYFDRVLGDMAHLPFANGAFDLVFGNCALHHTSDLDATFREMARVLRPGGRIMVVNESVRGWFRNRVPAPEEVEAGVNEHVFPIGEWMRAAKSAGFQGQVLFPGSVRAVLEGRQPVGGVKGLLVRLARSVWKVPGVRHLTESVLRRPLHTLCGLGFNFVGTKPLA